MKFHRYFLLPFAYSYMDQDLTENFSPLEGRNTKRGENWIKNPLPPHPNPLPRGGEGIMEKFCLWEGAA